MVVSKWVILVLTCLVGFGAYYSFETPSVLHNAMFRHYNIKDKDQFELYFSLIYSLYALPNMVIPLVGGVMADRFGNKTIMLVFATFILIGSAIETFACFQKSMEMFLIGRFVFGCGSETLNVCVSIVISKWFKGQELALALAIILSLSKLATVVTDWISPLMYRAIGIEANAVCVTSLCLVCYLLTILLTKLDTDEADHTHLHVRSNPNSMHSLHSLADLEEQFQAHVHSHKHLNRLAEEEQRPINNNSVNSSKQPEVTPDEGSQIQLTELNRHASETDSLLGHNANSAFVAPGSIPASHTNNNSTITNSNFNSSVGNAQSNTLFNASYDDYTHYTDPHYADLQHTDFQHPDLPVPHRYPPLPTYWGFTLPVWMVLVFTLVMYGTFIPFTNWSTVILLQFYFTKPGASPAYIAWSEIMAARLQSVPNFISVLLTPVFGLSVDWFGHRTTLLFCAAVFLVVAHSMIYTGVLASPVFPLVMIGLAFSIFGSVIWPCIPVLVEPSMQGTAYGIMTSFQNAGQFIVPLALSKVYQAAQSYVPCEGFFIASSVLAVTISVCIWVMDEVMNHGTLRLVDDQLVGFEMVDQSKPSEMYNLYGSSDMYDYYSTGAGSVGTGSGGGGYGSTNHSAHSVHSLHSYSQHSAPHAASQSSDRIRIAVPLLPLGGLAQLPRSTSHSHLQSATSSLSSNGLLSGSYELSSDMHQHYNHLNNYNNNNNTSNASYNNSNSHYYNPHYSTEPPSPLLGANKFSRLRAFSMSDTRHSVSKDLCSLSDSRHDTNSCSSLHSLHSIHSTRSHDSTGSPPGPIVVIPIPNVVRKSQEYYDRASSLQFPREDPHVLRRIISDRSREMHYAAQYSSLYNSGGRYGNGQGIAQTAPAYNGQIMDDYQRYRMQQIHEHNMKSQLRQQEELVLVASPRRSPRLL